MTDSTRVPRGVLVLAGAAEGVVCRLLAGLLPWSSRSQQDAWRLGYAEGLKDASKERTS